MTSPYITELLAEQHTRQLLRSAHHHRLARAAKPQRRARPAPRHALVLHWVIRSAPGAGA